MYLPVPPPPAHEPPRLPLDKKPTFDSSDPPPLPPANTTGRRSRVYTNKKKQEILQGIHNNTPQPTPSKLIWNMCIFLFY